MSKKKKVWRIITDVLAVLGVLFIVYMSVMIYQERKKLIKIDPNLEESYTVNILVTLMKSMKMIYP